MPTERYRFGRVEAITYDARTDLIRPLGFPNEDEMECESEELEQWECEAEPVLGWWPYTHRIRLLPDEDGDPEVDHGTATMPHRDYLVEVLRSGE